MIKYEDATDIEEEDAKYLNVEDIDDLGQAVLNMVDADGTTTAMRSGIHVDTASSGKYPFLVKVYKMVRGSNWMRYQHRS